MRRPLLALVLLAAVLPAIAQQNVKLERGTLALGDSVEKMLRIAGQPHAALPPAESPPGLKVYEYLTPTQRIRFTIGAGKVVGVGIGAR